MKSVVVLASFWIGGWVAYAQGPAVTPANLTFSYVMNSLSRPVAQTVKATLPAASSSLPLIIGNFSVPSNVCGATSGCGWVAVTPDQGHAPLTLSVTVNPTGLTPGSYTGSFQIDTQPGSGSPATVTVTLSIANPPSTILVSSPSSNYTAPSSAAATPTLAFQYTTGAAAATLVSSELDVSSTGDIIPFNVAAANASGSGSGTGSTAVWLRVSSKSPTQGQALTTSGSAGVGSLVPIFVTLDYATLQGLGIGNYFGTITIAAIDPKTNGSQTISVSLVVSAGAPSVTAVFPQSVVAGPPTDPVFTIYGSNFTLNTSVFLDVGTNSYQVQASLVSPKLLQVTVPAKDIPPVVAPATYPVNCTLTVRNGGFPAVTGTFQLTNPSAPSVTLVVNAASYLPLSKFAGTAADPAAAPNPQTAVSPREVISIFGQNLGPSVVSSAVPLPAAGLTPSMYDTTWSGITVTFSYTDTTVNPPAIRTALAPILMTSSSQINAIVPTELATVIGTASPTAVVTVTNGLLTSAVYQVTVLNEDPGIFTFGGLGQGQGAIINYDTNSAATINSKTNAEPRGNVIAIFATGLGDLTDPTIPNGALTSATALGVHLADESNVRVNIQGQPAVVLYAGSSPGAVAGLVQVNAIVPPTSGTGASIPITLSIGDKTVTRNAQTGVTLAVK